MTLSIRYRTAYDSSHYYLLPPSTYPMTKIIDSTPSLTPANGILGAPMTSLEKATAARKRADAIRQGLRTQLDKGVFVYPDVAPGVGWVLARKGHPKRYLRTKELAIAHYETLR